MSENPIFSYTKRDYEGSRKEGLARIPIISNGNWTDLNATDPGVIILDYVHALADMINYYQDHQALESFLSTAKERQNIFRLAKQLSYKISSAKGAICEVEFSSSLVFDSIVKIPKYTSLSTDSGIGYLTIDDAYLLPGTQSVTVQCSQGTYNKSTYVGTGKSRFSDVGATNQSVTLIAPNIDIDSISVVDNLGREWTAVDYIIFSNSTERVYQIDLNPDDSVSIIFGDGERGIVPSTSDTLTISYITTLAEEGRVGRNMINRVTSTIVDNEGRYVEFFVNNNNASVGGSKSQSSQEIKELAPGAIKAQGRAVTLSDFENLAKMIDGVSDARAYDINIKPDLCLYHEVKVLIIPDSDTQSIGALKQKVYDYISQRMIPPTNLQIIVPADHPVDINIVVKKLENTTEGRVSYEIQNKVKEYFQNIAGKIGEPFYPADLLSYLSKVEGVRYIVSVTPSDIVLVEELSVIKLGNLSITVE